MMMAVVSVTPGQCCEAGVGCHRVRVENSRRDIAGEEKWQEERNGGRREMARKEGK